MKDIIKKYANNISKEDIILFCVKEKVKICDNEVNIIYNCIKNDIDILLSDKSKEYLIGLKKKLNNDLYNKIIELYGKYSKHLN